MRSCANGAFFLLHNKHRSGRSQEGSDSCRRGPSWNHSRVYGHAWISCQGKGQRGIAQLGIPWCGSGNEPHPALSWQDANALLREREVTLLSAGLDKMPACYKNIETVMAAQIDLVEVLARFDPRLVKMCPSGERPED